MRTILVLLVLALVWASPASPVGADGGGVVEGRVINGSQGSSSVADLEVTLMAGSGPAGQLTTRTSPLGQFRFEGLPTSAGDTYAVTVRYQGVDYMAGDIRLSPEGPLAQVTVHVYEVTTSTEAIRVLLDHHIVKVKPEERRLGIVSYLKMANTGDRTVVASPGEAPLFPVPEGAEKLQLVAVSAENEAIPGKSGVTVGQAIPPGEHQLVLAYELPYTGDGLVFRKPLAYPTDKAVLVMSAHEGEAESQQLSAKKEMDSAAGSYQILSGEDLPAGTVLEVTFTGLPAGGGTSLGNVLRPAAVIVAILALGSIVAYLRLRRRRARPSEG